MGLTLWKSGGTPAGPGCVPYLRGVRILGRDVPLKNWRLICATGMCALFPRCQNFGKTRPYGNLERHLRNRDVCPIFVLLALWECTTICKFGYTPTELGCVPIFHDVSVLRRHDALEIWMHTYGTEICVMSPWCQHFRRTGFSENLDALRRD